MQVSEEERLEHYRSQLLPDMYEGFLKEAKRLRAQVAGKWINDVEPMDFNSFCVALDGCPLYPRQELAFTSGSVNLLRANNLLSPTRTLREWVLLFGKGAGKDYISAKFIAYVAFLICHLKGDPCDYFRSCGATLAPESELAVMNVAPDADTAQRIFFNQYLKKFIAHNLFKPFCPMIFTDRIFFKATNSSGFEYNKIAIYSMHSRASGLDGYNLVAWIMDEADAFTNSDYHDNAAEVHDILRTSCNTRMGRMWFGMVITYTRYFEGFAMSMYERAKANPLMYYVDRAATWEVNPNFDRNGDEVLEMYATRPREARAMYECIPGTDTDDFFEFPEWIDRSVDTPRIPAASFTLDTTYVTLETGEIVEYAGLQILSVCKEPGRTYFAGVDAGKKRDSFAIAIFSADQSDEAVPWLCPECGQHETIRSYGHYMRIIAPTPKSVGIPVCGICGRSVFDVSPVREGGTVGWWQKNGDNSGTTIIGGKAYELPKLREELIVAVVPYEARKDSEMNRPVDYPGVAVALSILMHELDIAIIGFDPWMTAQMSMGLQAETGKDVRDISFANDRQYERASLYKALLYSNLLSLLPDKPRDREVKRLKGKGRSVDHPPERRGQKEGKDRFDAESIAIYLAANYLHPEISAHFLTS